MVGVVDGYWLGSWKLRNTLVGRGMIANRILRTWTLLRVILLGLYGLLWVSGRDDNPQGVWPSPK